MNAEDTAGVAAAWRSRPRRAALAAWDAGFDLLLRTCAGAAAPSLLLRLADAAGLAASASGLGLPAAPLRRLLGDRPPQELAQVARAIFVHSYRDRAVHHIVRRRGLERLLPLIRCSGCETLLSLHRQGLPAVIVFAHMGPPTSVPAGFCALGVPAVLVRTGAQSFSFPPAIEVLTVKQSQERALLSLKGLLDRLKRGAMVLLALDGSKGGVHLRLDFLGRRFDFPVGLAVLHRLTGAPLVPVRTAWTAGQPGIAFAADPPLSLPDRALSGAERDAALVKIAVNWLQDWIMREPEQLRLGRVRKFLRQPDSR